MQIADEAIDVTFPRRLVDDIFVVVISQTPGELFVIHLGLVLADTPSPGNLIRVGEFEFPAVTRPGDKMLAVLVCEKL